MKAQLEKYLKNLGFKKFTHLFYFRYVSGKEVIALPKGRLDQQHIMAVRKHLDMNGYLSTEEFDEHFMKTNENNFTNDELSFIENALNSYWHEIMKKALTESKLLMNKIQKL